MNFAGLRDVISQTEFFIGPALKKNLKFNIFQNVLLLTILKWITLYKYRRVYINTFSKQFSTFTFYVAAWYLYLSLDLWQ
jgi:hypothetical protein